MVGAADRSAARWPMQACPPFLEEIAAVATATAAVVLLFYTVVVRLFDCETLFLLGVTHPRTH